MLFPKTTKAPFTTDRNTEENDGFWPNLEFATHRFSEDVGIGLKRWENQYDYLVVFSNQLAYRTALVFD